MGNESLFNEQEPQSLIKSAIVSRYFWRWANIILSRVKKNPDGKIAYVDLFAGPGRYEDGSLSTPLLIIRQAIAKPDLSRHLVTIFNDKDERNAQALESAIASFPNIEKMRHRPIVLNKEVSTEIMSYLEKLRDIPTLLFIDPWGYKGLSLSLINFVLKEWGSDCIFFFNYNRINMGLTNPVVEEHMNALFGKDKADKLRDKLQVLDVDERELVIVEELSQALNASGKRYVLPFRFRTSSGTRTSHHLIFVTKHFRGYEKMKETMAKLSSTTEQEVPSFEYNPARERQPLLFELARPIDDLAGLLLNEFAGRTLTMQEIYEQHNIGRPFIKKNYKTVLLQLEKAKKISTHPDKRRAGTFADHVKVTFPSKNT